MPRQDASGVDQSPRPRGRETGTISAAVFVRWDPPKWAAGLDADPCSHHYFRHRLRKNHFLHARGPADVGYLGPSPLRKQCVHVVSNAHHERSTLIFYLAILPDFASFASQNYYYVRRPLLAVGLRRYVSYE